MKKLLLAGTTVLLMATSANAGPEAEHRGHWVSPGQWQMNDIGRNHGVLGGPGDPPPLKWSDLRYVFDIQEDCNGKEAIQA